MGLLARLMVPRADVTWHELDDRWYTSLGVQSEAGIRVTPDVAMRVSTVYRAVNVLANALAMIPLVVWKRLSNGGKERDPGHYAFPLLHDQPNAWQTSYRWRHMVMGHLLLRGNHYSQIIPGPRGFMQQLIPLHPDRTRVTDQLADGRLLYVHTTKGGEERRINQEFMFHPRGFSHDGVTGVSVITLMRDAVGLALAAEKHGARFLRQGIHLSGVLSHPKTLDEEAAKRVAASWREAYGGLDNVGSIPVLEEGMEWHSIGMSNQDAQYLQTRDFQVADLLRFLGVPGVLVGHAEKTATYASAEQFFLKLVMHSVAPWAVTLQQEMTSAFILDPETHFVEFVLEGLLRGDVKTRYQAHQTAILAGWKTRNEVRIEENMNPADEALDEFLEPTNMHPAGEEPEEPVRPGRAPIEDDDEENAAAARLRLFARDAAARVVRKEIAAIGGASGRLGAALRYARDPEGWHAWVRSFYDKHAEFVALTLRIDPTLARAYTNDQASELLRKGVAVVESWEAQKVPLLTGWALSFRYPDERRPDMAYDRILRYVSEQPWALLPDTLAAMRDVLRLRAAGTRLTDEEIRARLAAQEKRRESSGATGVAVLGVYGLISQRADMFTDISGGTSTERLTAQFRAALADPAVRAIVLDTDSPGGGVYGVGELADEIRAARGSKPVVAVVNSLGASAAYWLASAAEELVITPSGEAGSIGVYTAHEDVSKALEAEGVKVTLVSAGKHKIEGNPFEPLSDEARQALQERVNDYYGMFVRSVAKGRGVSPAKVREGFGQGRLVGAKEAVALGIADRVGTLDETIVRFLGRRGGGTTSASVPGILEAEAIRLRRGRANLATAVHRVYSTDNDRPRMVGVSCQRS